METYDYFIKILMVNTKTQEFKSFKHYVSTFDIMANCLDDFDVYAASTTDIRFYFWAFETDKPEVCLYSHQQQQNLLEG
jgi:hypothetical protein